MLLDVNLLRPETLKQVLCQVISQAVEETQMKCGEKGLLIQNRSLDKEIHF